jgi:hypothetical protein
MDVHERRFVVDIGKVRQNRRAFLGRLGKSAAFLPSFSYMLMSSKTSSAVSQFKDSDGIHDEKFYDDILRMTHEKMRETWHAEAILQGLQAMWNLPTGLYTWAVAGHGGAVGSGHATCGLLIGSSVAVGFRYGLGNDGNPSEFVDEKRKAVESVGMLYHDFLKEYGSTQCQTLLGVDFSKPEDKERYRSDRIGETKCDVFLDFLMNRFIELTKQGRI